MSNNLTIPAAVWACRVDGVPLVAGVVEGECPIGCAYDGTGRGKHGMFCSAAGSKPPVDLVALRDAKQPVDVRVEPVCAKPHNSASACCSHAYEGGECCWCGTAFRTVTGLIDVARVYVDRAEVDHQEPCIFHAPSAPISPWWYMKATKLDGWQMPLTPAHVEALGTIQPGQWAWTFTEVEA